jgi:hypothetical protein
VLDERADALEARARHLEGLQADSFREQRRRITAAQEAGLSGALSRAADQTRRATEQLSAAMAEGMNSIILTAPAPIQQLARDVDRTMAPLADGARGAFATHSLAHSLTRTYARTHTLPLLTRACAALRAQTCLASSSRG